MSGQMRVGDAVTFAVRPTRWQRFVRWLLRRPEPLARRFVVTHVSASEMVWVPPGPEEEDERGRILD